MSPTAPSRHQSYRARSKYFVGEVLEEFMRNCRRTALKVAREIGLLDPDAGSWTNPARTQIVVGDKTWMPAATRFHRDDPPNPDTGKPRRCDPDADFHHTRNGQPTEVPGRELTVLSVRGDDPNVRILLDAEFLKHKDQPERLKESDLAVAMLKRLIDENADDLTDGIRGFGYDMALTPKSIDDVLNLHRLPVVKVPKLAKRRFRNQSLGPHEFTTRTGDEETLDVRTLNGAVWVWLPEGHKLQAVPLVRTKLQRGTPGARRTLLYMHAAIPNDADVPEPLRGATTLIRVNSTKEEIANKPHTRRSLSLRPIPESDPHFAEISEPAKT